MSSPVPLENLSGPGKALKAEPPDTQELAGLTRTGRARLPVPRPTLACWVIGCAGTLGERPLAYGQ